MERFLSRPLLDETSEMLDARRRRMLEKKKSQSNGRENDDDFRSRLSIPFDRHLSLSLSLSLLPHTFLRIN